MEACRGSVEVTVGESLGIEGFTMSHRFKD